MRQLLNKYLPILLLIIFPLGQLTVVPISASHIRFYYHDLIIAIIIINNLSFLIRTSIKYTPFIGFAFVSGFSLLLQLDTLTYLQVLTASLYLVRLLAYLSLIIVLPQIITYQQARPYIYYGIAVSVIMGFAQYIFFPLLEPLYILGWDRHAYRLVGTHLDPNFTGLLLTLSILWMLHDIFLMARSKNARIKLHLTNATTILLASIVAVILTYSRSTYLTFLITIPLFLRKIIRFKYLFIAASIILISISLLPNRFGEGTKLARTSTIFARVNNWEQGLNLFLQEPLFGHGYNTLKYLRTVPVSREYITSSHSASGIDNSLLMLLTTVGLMGTLQFIWFLMRICKHAPYRSLLISTLVAITIHSMFQNSLLYPWTLIWLAFITLKK